MQKHNFTRYYRLRRRLALRRRTKSLQSLGREYKKYKEPNIAHYSDSVEVKENYLQMRESETDCARRRVETNHTPTSARIKVSRLHRYASRNASDLSERGSVFKTVLTVRLSLPETYRPLSIPFAGIAFCSLLSAQLLYIGAARPTRPRG